MAGSETGYRSRNRTRKVSKQRSKQRQVAVNSLSIHLGQLSAVQTALWCLYMLAALVYHVQPTIGYVRGFLLDMVGRVGCMAAGAQSAPCSNGNASARQRSMPPARFATCEKPDFCSSTVACAERTPDLQTVTTGRALSISVLRAASSANGSKRAPGM